MPSSILLSVVKGAPARQWCRQVLLPKGLAFVSSCGIVAAQLALVTLEPFQPPPAPSPPDIVVSLVSLDDPVTPAPQPSLAAPSPERRPRPIPAVADTAKPERPKPPASTTTSAAAPMGQAEASPASAPQPRVATAPPPPPAAALAIKTPAQDDVLCHYQERIWNMIMAKRPAGVRLRGAAQIAFRLTPDGAPLDVKVARTSGDPMLDRLAVDTVKRAGPFPAPPATIANDTVFEIRFQFR